MPIAVYGKGTLGEPGGDIQVVPLARFLAAAVLGGLGLVVAKLFADFVPLALVGFALVGLGVVARAEGVDFVLQDRLLELPVLVELLGGRLGHGRRPRTGVQVERSQPLESRAMSRPTATSGLPVQRARRAKSGAAKDPRDQPPLARRGTAAVRFPSGTTNDSLQAGHWIRWPKWESLTWRRWPLGQVVS